METAQTRSTGCLSTLLSRALRSGVPAATAGEARAITAARFGIRGDAPVSRRAEAYFWGIVRRRALKGGAPAFADSLLALSLATELTAAGHCPEQVRREVARVYGEAFLAVVEPARSAVTAA